MLTVTKDQVGSWMLLDYLSQKQLFEEKIAGLEKKYDRDFASFENCVEQLDTEDFAAWDDLIEWKAYTQFLIEINAKIADIRNGDFQMAG